MRLAVPILLAVAALTAPASAWAGEGEIIVKRDAGLDHAQRAALRKRADVRLVEALPLPRTELVTPPDGDVPAALAALNRDPSVVYAEVDGRVHAADTDDPWYPHLWGLDNVGQVEFGQVGVVDADIDAPEAWARSLGANVLVGVIDTGVNAAQPDLAGRIDTVQGYDWVDGGTADDANGHGTHVTGTIVALRGNHVGIAGVAPDATVVPLRVLDASGSGWDSDVALAVDYAGDLGLPIANLSLGGAESSAVAEAIAAHPETLYVVAAGNDADDDDDPAAASYPCALPYANIVCVGASDNRDLPASFSNYGSITVDLFAPGVDVVSTYLSGYAFISGTSQAAPHVAGAAALALAADPGATTAELRDALLTSVDQPAGLACLSATGGRLNADSAVQAIGTPGSPPPQDCPPEPTPTPEPPVPTPVPTPVATPVATPTPSPTPAAAKLSRVGISGSLRTRTSRLRVRFTLTRAASVRFSVTRRGARKAIASWTRAGRAGANVVYLTRRLPTRRTLTPGSYSLGVRLAGSARSARFSVR